MDYTEFQNWLFPLDLLLLSDALLDQRRKEKCEEERWNSIQGEGVRGQEGQVLTSHEPAVIKAVGEHGCLHYWGCSAAFGFWVYQSSSDKVLNLKV